MTLGPLRLAFALCALVACARTRGPETPAEAVATFASVLEQSAADPTLRRRVYNLLSHRAQEALGERAARASQVSGRSFEAWEMLSPGRVRMRIQPDPATLSTRVSGERAVVTARGRMGGLADVPLVREEGRWRVDLALEPIVAPRASQGTRGP